MGTAGAPDEPAKVALAAASASALKEKERIQKCIQKLFGASKRDEKLMLQTLAHLQVSDVSCLKDK